MFRFQLCSNLNNTAWLGMEPSAWTLGHCTTAPLHHWRTLAKISAWTVMGRQQQSSRLRLPTTTRLTSSSLPIQDARARARARIHHKHTVFLHSFSPGVNPPSFLEDSLSTCVRPLKHEIPPQCPTNTRGAPLCCPPPPFIPSPLKRKKRRPSLYLSCDHLPRTFLSSSSFTKCVAYMTRAGPFPSRLSRNPPPPLNPTGGALKRLVGLSY